MDIGTTNSIQWQGVLDERTKELLRRHYHYGSLGLCQ